MMQRIAGGNSGLHKAGAAAGLAPGPARRRRCSKYLAAEKAVEMARRCIQIRRGRLHPRLRGRLLRDAVVMPIYEGTGQIQSLMAMKDALLRIIRQAAGVCHPRGAGMAQRVGAG